MAELLRAPSQSVRTCTTHIHLVLFRANRLSPRVPTLLRAATWKYGPALLGIRTHAHLHYLGPTPSWTGPMVNLQFRHRHYKLSLLFAFSPGMNKHLKHYSRRFDTVLTQAGRHGTDWQGIPRHPATTMVERSLQQQLRCWQLRGAPSSEERAHRQSSIGAVPTPRSIEVQAPHLCPVEAEVAAIRGGRGGDVHLQPSSFGRFSSSPLPPRTAVTSTSTGRSRKRRRSREGAAVVVYNQELRGNMKGEEQLSIQERRDAAAMDYNLGDRRDLVLACRSNPSCQMNKQRPKPHSDIQRSSECIELLKASLVSVQHSEGAEHADGNASLGIHRSQHHWEVAGHHRAWHQSTLHAANGMWSATVMLCRHRRRGLAHNAIVEGERPSPSCCATVKEDVANCATLEEVEVNLTSCRHATHAMLRTRGGACPYRVER
uniref:Uncharacterized protein n=1 Tax=Oryza sativa subsp. japonica TaxID=39947 RepID=Q6EPK7_ORYSJ|nr:hypothetical protein [Oryza sativa Japonica Group]